MTGPGGALSGMSPAPGRTDRVPAVFTRSPEPGSGVRETQA
jgi:hypothetical protein